jgi:hypothetical protein
VPEDGLGPVEDVAALLEVELIVEVLDFSPGLAFEILTMGAA